MIHVMYIMLEKPSNEGTNKKTTFLSDKSRSTTKKKVSRLLHSFIKNLFNNFP